MKRAEVYLRGGCLFLLPSVQTVIGAWISGEPVTRIEPLEEGRTGTAVLEALAASRVGVEHPSTWDGLTQPLQSAAGAKTWLGFARTARLVLIECEDEQILFLPTQRQGGGFLHLPDQQLLCGLDEVEIGATLRSAFERCL